MVLTAYRNLRTTFKCAALHALGVVRKLDRSAGNAVLLTFDDGPHPDVTPGVLDRLKEYGAKAVFFVVGNRIPKAPHLLARIRDEGHIIGNHSFEHWLDRSPGPREYARDLERCQKEVGALVDEEPTLFRPPLGGISLASLLAGRAAGLRTVLWSLDSEDWKLRRREDALKSGQQLCELICPRDIVLCHDDNPCVLTILDVLLPELARREMVLQRDTTKAGGRAPNGRRRDTGKPRTVTVDELLDQCKG